MASGASPGPQIMLETAITAFDTALAAFQQPNHGRVDTLAKNALIHALRTYVQAYIARNPAVTDDPKSRAEDMPSDYQAGTSRTYQYTEDDYGKVADYATAYEDSTGHRGPWSNVTSLLISG